MVIWSIFGRHQSELRWEGSIQTESIRTFKVQKLDKKNC